ncbi:hypothetical protein QJS10_CPB04g00949 [Acorus calamus]|uniref:Uncharacterized protein n=1 Tax=Acorus calamus TaxID=4465 RepID=A0AAV9F0D4_ACOCL|nr:hypothetical protein QJS10_CPB04g00949 [Acorus calamus]
MGKALKVIPKLTYLRRSEQQRKRDENKQTRPVRATDRHFDEDEGVGSERTKGRSVPFSFCFTVGMKISQVE